MVSSRVAVGSVSTLAAAALLIGAAPLVLRTWSQPSQTPWGTISSFSGNLSSSDPIDGDRSQLLKLAALKSSKAAPSSNPAMAAAAELAAPPSTAPAAPAPADAPPTPTASLDANDAAMSGSTTLEQAPGPTTSADASTGDAEAVPLPPASSPRTLLGLININRAPSDALDHFPGAGRIGRAIVSHRPYHTIADLVRKRVLRTSDFARIQSHISVD